MLGRKTVYSAPMDAKVRPHGRRGVLHIHLWPFLMLCRQGHPEVVHAAAATACMSAASMNADEGCRRPHCNVCC